MKQFGRKLTTGRFSTRRELLDRIGFLYYSTACNVSQIAKSCGVSETVVHKLIDSHQLTRRPDNA